MVGINGSPGSGIEDAGAAPAGWYPVGDGQLRWWDGGVWTPTMWTQGAASPSATLAGGPVKRRVWLSVVAVVLLLPLAASPVLFFMFAFGDPFPESRVGVMRSGDGLAVVNAVCPGERLRRIEVRRVPEDESGVRPVIWAITGDRPLEETVPLGADIEAMLTTTALRRQPGALDRLSVRVETSELANGYDLEIRVDDIPANGVVTFDGVHSTLDEFERAAIAATPCSASDDLGGGELVTLLAFLAVIPCTVLSVVLFAITRRVHPSGSGPRPVT